MATYKLSYFNLRGLAEGSRLLFALAGVHYEDFRFPFSKKEDGSFARTEWEAAKNDAKYTWSKVPILEYTDGGHTTVVAQSKAIERFLARRFGFYGRTDVESALIDGVCEEITDARLGYQSASSKDDAVKAAGVTVEQNKTHLHKFLTEDLPNFLTLFEKVLGKNDYFVGGHVSLADVQLFSLLTHYSMPADTVAKFAGLQSLVKRISENARIKEWLAKRPQTMF